MSLKDSMDPRIEELLPFYALDALTDEERELVEAYLAQHPEVREQINDLHSAASKLPYGITPVEPPRQVKESLMARVNADAEARSQTVERAPRPTLQRRPWFENLFQVLSLGAAAVAIVWAILLNGQVSRLQTEITGLHDTLAKQSTSLEQILANLPKSPVSNVITVSLKGTNVQPDAHGQLIADPKEQTAVLIISGLPKLEANRTYQVWLITDSNTMVSAGLLSVDESGQGVVIVTSRESIGSFKSLGISVEPRGGSPQPTGNIVVLSDI